MRISAESTFALCSFGGMLLLMKGRRQAATVAFALSAGCRGNGFLGAGFLVYDRLRDVSDLVLGQNTRSKLGAVAHAVKLVGLAILEAVVVMLPFLLTQFHAYGLYCSHRDVGMVADGDDVQVEPRPWCLDSLPSLYGFVQRHYWNNGFLAYWTMQQVPNFVLASPMWALSAGTVVAYCRGNGNVCRTLGLLPDTWYRTNRQRGRRRGEGKTEHEEEERRAGDASVVWRSYQSPGQCVYIVYLCALSLFALLFMHVQVTTRFIAASCPSIYWYGATLCVQRVRLSGEDCPVWPAERAPWLARLVIGYFLGFLVLGVALHVNFYPFT